MPPKAFEIPDDARKLAGTEGSYEDTLRQMFEGIQSQDELTVTNTSEEWVIESPVLDDLNLDWILTVRKKV